MIVRLSTLLCPRALLKAVIFMMDEWQELSVYPYVSLETKINGVKRFAESFYLKLNQKYKKIQLKSEINMTPSLKKTNKNLNRV